MTQTHTLQFLHRLNKDGTIDSICRECFATVVTSVWESNLEVEERKHRCDPSQIERYKKYQHSKNFA